MNERPIPEAARRDPNSVELLRAWIAERGLHCSLKIGMYRDMGKPEERAWGILLADVSRHVANAIAEEFGGQAQDAIKEIQRHYLAELAKPTSTATGKFV